MGGVCVCDVYVRVYIIVRDESDRTCMHEDTTKRASGKDRQDIIISFNQSINPSLLFRLFFPINKGN